MLDDEYEKMYRPSATIIICAKSTKEQGYDFKVLLALRSKETQYAPGHHVFPGGVFDVKSDEDSQWLQYFQQFGVWERDLDKVCLDHLSNRPRPLMTNKKHFSRDISLRITAIREAFEEVGILLCLNRIQLKEGHKVCGTFNVNFDRSYWQKRVHENSNEFINLCKYLDVVPDIWALHEWSIWRSPQSALKKYDTVIYLANLEEQPELLLELSEIESAQWLSPVLSLKLYQERLIWLAPLQFYELCRMSNVTYWRNLKKFAQERSNKGSTLLMIAYYRCDDFFVGLLPNDGYYPKEPSNHTKTIPLSESASDFENKTQNLHRLKYRDMYDITITCNIQPIDHHLSPVPRIKDNISNL